MANILNTRIVSCTDTTANLESSDKVYLKGEIVIEVTTDGDYKIKIGDGTNQWKDLKYAKSNSDGSSVYTYQTTDTTDITGAVTALGLTDLKGGEMVVLSNTADSANQVAGYVCVLDADDNTPVWQAFGGNVTADNVYFKDDLQAAGNYSQIGNITKSANGTATLSWANKSLNDVMKQIFSKELQPTKTEPSVSITFSQAGSYEVGSSVTPYYTATLNAGSYTYSSTGVTASSWSVVDSDGNTSTESSGSFAAFVVDDSTNYTIKATATYGAGNVATTNLGNASSPVIQIAAGSKEKTSGAVTGYRSFFYGALTNDNELTSDIVRGLANGGVYNGSKSFSINPVSGAVRYIIAIPHSSTRGGLSSATLPNSLNANVTSLYVKTASAVNVDDKRGNGNNSVAYDVYEYKPASIGESEIHDIVLA